jgi:hypothetical protein
MNTFTVVYAPGVKINPTSYQTPMRAYSKVVQIGDRILHSVQGAIQAESFVAALNLHGNVVLILAGFRPVTPYPTPGRRYGPINKV